VDRTEGRTAPTEEKEPTTGLVREAVPESRAEVERLVDEADRGLKVLNERLGFQVHEDSGQLFVQVVDRETGEVIRESPPEEFLDLVVRMKEMVGVFLDETR
jgi:flagellar protein FlaG